jgi:N-methylhydantoinase A
VGAPLGFDAEQTAAAAMRIVDSHMADAIRLASVQQGYDPRDHVFYAYGGAGPLHAAALCRELGMRRIVVPLSDLASSWSAFGVVSSDAVVIDEVPMVMSHPFDVERLNTAWARLEDNVAASMQEQGIERATVAFERSMALRYTPQINQVDVAVPAGAFEATAAEDVIERFEAEYARLFGEGTGYADAGFTMTSMRVRARAPLNNRDLLDEHPSGADGAPTRKGEREVIFYEDSVQRQSTPVYDGETFRRGMTVEGPAIVEFPDTTLVVWSDQQAAVDRYGSVEVVLAL